MKVLVPVSSGLGTKTFRSLRTSHIKMGKFRSSNEKSLVQGVRPKRECSFVIKSKNKDYDSPPEGRKLCELSRRRSLRTVESRVGIVTSALLEGLCARSV